jgi:hypothetical protein
MCPVKNPGFWGGEEANENLKFVVGPENFTNLCSDL